MHVAFLGLGRMGRILAGHVLDAGFTLTVWNRTPSTALEALRDRGAQVAWSAADAVSGADVVITALFGPQSVREVVLLAALPIPATAVWMDVTTVSPADAQAHASWAADSGVRFVHAPVIGSLGPAQNRSLGVTVGGAAEDVDVVLPLFALWADQERIQRYDAAGQAAAGKLVANLALAVSMQGLIEAVTLGQSGGLTVDETLTTLQGTALGMIAGMKGANVRSGDFSNTQFSADLLAKDARLMIDTAGTLPALSIALDALQRAQDAGAGDDDFSVVAREIGALDRP